MTTVVAGLVVALIILVLGFAAIYPYCLYLKGIDDRPLPFRVNGRGDIISRSAMDQQDVNQDP